mmetsp:Transcript_80873/g.158021  ORF Transcript_80873/g.158021 Transcript_80873/m.158021 type:complete len:170 (+) Transcript_80873:52-561(+)
MKTITAMFLSICVLEITAFQSSTFVTPSGRRMGRMFSSTRPEFAIDFEMPAKGITEYGTAQLRMAPVLAASEPVIVRYRLPFGLDVAPPNSEGLCVCSKAGTGGEQPGDVLRFTTYWRGKTPGLYDVVKQTKAGGAKAWDATVAALVSNDLGVTDEIVLVFERPTPPSA